uniref:hypothetical protein n=1 Tax=Pseudorhizobium marinum TaxID=1496690 RepID=UPI0004981BFE
IATIAVVTSTVTGTAGTEVAAVMTVIGMAGIGTAGTGMTRTGMTGTGVAGIVTGVVGTTTETMIAATGGAIAIARRPKAMDTAAPVPEAAMCLVAAGKICFSGA